MPLTRIPNPAKTAKSCNLKMLEDGYLTGSIIKSKHMKGWWPFSYNPDDDDDPNPFLAVGSSHNSLIVSSSLSSYCTLFFIISYRFLLYYIITYSIISFFIVLSFLYYFLVPCSVLLFSILLYFFISIHLFSKHCCPNYINFGPWILDYHIFLRCDRVTICGGFRHAKQQYGLQI